MKNFKIQLFFLISLTFTANKSFAGFIEPKQSLKENYFIEINLNKNNCEKIINSRCIFRDNLTDSNAYFHKTKLIIFQSKIIAYQEFNDSNKIFKIKNSSYKLRTNKGNLIKFKVINGKIHNFKVLKGGISKEINSNSLCNKNQFLYNYHKAYGKKEFTEKYHFYANRFKKHRLTEMLILQSKDQVFAMKRKNNESFKPINNLQLCKFPQDNKLYVKYSQPQDCLNKNINKECEDYHECEDFMIVKNCKIEYLR